MDADFEDQELFVIKRDGRIVPFEHEKVVDRVLLAMDYSKAGGEEDFLASLICEILVSKLTSPVESFTIDYLLSGLAADMQGTHIAYASVATNIELDRLYSKTHKKFSSAMEEASEQLSSSFLHSVRRHSAFFDGMIDERRDQLLSFFSLRSLARSYLLRDGDTLFERPQFLWARVAVYIHHDDIDNVKATYDLLSNLQIMFSSPILFNSGMKRSQLSSCFLLPAEKNPDNIFETLSRAARISRGGGGIGLGLQKVPGTGSKVGGIVRSGLVPVLKLFDSAMEVFDQGQNKRPSAISVSIEPWHCDVLPFIRMKRVKGVESDRAKKLFFALWVPDLFMRRVIDDEDWTLFCPSVAKDLTELCGDAFEMRYRSYEEEGKGTQVIKARVLWKEIIAAQVESGGPSILFKDHVNVKSNERHLGVITQSNLCTEIVQFTDVNETAVCTLASVALPTFVTRDCNFDFPSMERAVRTLVLALNRIIDISTYPCSSTRESARAHRAIGIGSQGLADCFALMGFPFDSESAKILSTTISEGIYHSALDESCRLTRLFGTYSTFPGSPLSQGWFQFDMWDADHVQFSGQYDWERLREKIRKGTCNALLTAGMPTAGTTQITGFSEASEPFESLYYTRRVLAGEFQVSPVHLVERLHNNGLWDEDLTNRIIANGGSVQGIESIPIEIRNVYKTVWEVPPETLVRMAAARAPFICQSQSLSIYMEEPSFYSVSRTISLAWKMGLKTGLYYLRTKSASKALPVTLPVSLWSKHAKPTEDRPACVACSA